MECMKTLDYAILEWGWNLIPNEGGLSSWLIIEIWGWDGLCEYLGDFDSKKEVFSTRENSN